MGSIYSSYRLFNLVFNICIHDDGQIYSIIDKSYFKVFLIPEFILSVISCLVIVAL